MDSTDTVRMKREYHEFIGACDAISTLKVELVSRLEEARDDDVHEVLDNIIALVDAQGLEYQRRRDELHAQLSPGSSDVADA